MIDELLDRVPAARPARSASQPRRPLANFFRWWALYRDGDEAAVQEQLCFVERLTEPFDPERIEDFVLPRATETDEGQPISEWRVLLAEVQAFLDRGQRPI